VMNTAQIEALEGAYKQPPAQDQGRDAHYCVPPAQNCMGGIPAYGSHLGCLTRKR
jgi:hypothetical protein